MHRGHRSLVGAFQIKIKHNDSFKLELTDDALVSDYRTTNNSTIIIIVAPETDFLFSTQDHYFRPISMIISIIND